MKRLYILLSLSLAIFLNIGCGQDRIFYSSSSNDFSRETRTFHFKHAPKIQVDILFVVDISGSMGDDHRNISQIFQNFISYISEFDYRIGFITGEEDIASLKQVGQDNEKYIDPSMFFKEELFQQAMESFPAIRSLGEQPFGALLHAIQDSKDQNYEFFRHKAKLITIILSDEEEQTTGLPMPIVIYNSVVKSLNLDYEDYFSFSITNENDSARTREFCGMTGGLNISVFASDIGLELEQISEWIYDELSKTVVLDPPPLNPEEVEIKVFNAITNEVIDVNWTIRHGNHLVFQELPPFEIIIQVTYEEDLSNLEDEDISTDDEDTGTDDEDTGTDDEDTGTDDEDTGTDNALFLDERVKKIGLLLKHHGYNKRRKPPWHTGRKQPSLFSDLSYFFRV